MRTNKETYVPANFTTYKNVARVSVYYLCLKVVPCNNLNLPAFLNVILIEISRNCNLHRFSV